MSAIWTARVRFDPPCECCGPEYAHHEFDSLTAAVQFAESCDEACDIEMPDGEVMSVDDCREMLEDGK